LQVAASGSKAQQLYAEAKMKLAAVAPLQIMRNMRILGVADTIVGNDLLRGVSGGEKKRVTVAEVRVCGVA
jgi:ABC-type multidrug transport system ATPase subunit